MAVARNAHRASLCPCATHRVVDLGAPFLAVCASKRTPPVTRTVPSRRSGGRRAGRAPMPCGPCPSRWRCSGHITRRWIAGGRTCVGGIAPPSTRTSTVRESDCRVAPLAPRACCPSASTRPVLGSYSSAVARESPWPFYSELPPATRRCRLAAASLSLQSQLDHVAPWLIHDPDPATCAPRRRSGTCRGRVVAMAGRDGSVDRVEPHEARAHAIAPPRAAPPVASTATSSAISPTASRVPVRRRCFAPYAAFLWATRDGRRSRRASAPRSRTSRVDVRRRSRHRERERDPSVANRSPEVIHRDHPAAVADDLCRGSGWPDGQAVRPEARRDVADREIGVIEEDHRRSLASGSCRSAASRSGSPYASTCSAGCSVAFSRSLAP